MGAPISQRVIGAEEEFPRNDWHLAGRVQQEWAAPLTL